METGAPPHRTTTPLFTLAERLWPALRTMPLERRLVGSGEVLSCLYIAPLALIGLVWLWLASDLSLVREHPLVFLLHGALIVILNRLSFFLIVELRTNRYGSANGALDWTVLWSALFLFGPTALWLMVLWSIAQFIYTGRKPLSPAAQWSRRRNLFTSTAETTLAPLVALHFFHTWGGTLPLRTLSVTSIALGMLAIFMAFLVRLLIWAGYIVYGAWTQYQVTGTHNNRPIVQFFALALGLPVLAQPYAILTASLWSQHGLAVFLFVMTGLLLVAALTRQLSWMAERDRQQSHLLTRLEALSRAIINAPPTTESLIEILARHTTNMFPSGNMAIWLFPAEVLVKMPPDWQPDLRPISEWLNNQMEVAAFTATDDLPWQPHFAAHNPVLVAPILDVESNQPRGGIFIELRPLAQPWHRKSLTNLFPAVRSLAAQVASALDQAKIYTQTLDYQRMMQELRLAGEIQASFLPFKIPRIPGWQIAVTLDPVGETSGDFFDIIPLDDGRLGIVVADVADKGIGPALFMALSRTLLRTYAIEFNAEPELVFYATNERILKDTEANLFVTTFYGVLDLNSGELTYANAGHNPTYLFRSEEAAEVQALSRTGIPIGIEADITWAQARARLAPGDVLVLYSDGIPDTQDQSGRFFGETTLVEIVKQNRGASAEEIQRAIIDAVYEFMGEAPQFDDITLIVLVRNA